jgi:iron(III) transport system ATP-binding protein
LVAEIAPSQESMLSIEGLVKTFRAEHGELVRAVNDIDLEVKKGEVITLLGPSGCGKTTTLRSIAGLERPDSGRITLDGQTVFAPNEINVPTYKRPIAMVFQSYAIWPHMTVFENLAFPLKVGKEKVKKPEIEQRVMQALELVKIPELAHRDATRLSGGQQQRVALARALVREPSVLLLDEPLSNLDAKLREEMRLELKELFFRTGITGIYVTHDLLEALVLSDRVVVMNAGVIAQSGSPREVYAQPESKFVAEFMGAGNILYGMAQETLGDRVNVRLNFGDIVARCHAPISEGSTVLLAMRPDGLTLNRTASSDTGTTSLPCTVDASAFQGSTIEYRVTVGDRALRVWTTATDEEFERGASAHLHIPPDSCVVLPMDGAPAATIASIP